MLRRESCGHAGWRCAVLLTLLAAHGPLAIAGAGLRFELPVHPPAADKDDASADVPDESASASVVDDDVTQLPPIVVHPMGNLPSLRMGRDRYRFRQMVPGLGTDKPRTKPLAEKLTDAFGLTGPGVQALHPADQQRLKDFAERLDRLK